MALLGFIIPWVVGGAVFGLFIGLGRDSLWAQIAGINSMIMILTFAAASFALPIDFTEV
jgi:hypothetical protein